MTTIKMKNFTKTTAVRRESLVIVIRFELSPGGKGCGFLFKRTGVRLPYYRGKNSINPVIYECVRIRARTHHLLPRKERELVRLRRFSFLRDLVVFCSRSVLLAWPELVGVAALQSKSSTLGPHARGDELGLTAVAFSLFICFHLHLGFAFRPSEHLLAQAVHEVARARRAVRIQRVLLVLARGRCPESSSNARAHGCGIIWSLLARIHRRILSSSCCAAQVKKPASTSPITASGESRSARGL